MIRDRPATSGLASLKVNATISEPVSNKIPSLNIRKKELKSVFCEVKTRFLLPICGFHLLLVKVHNCLKREVDFPLQQHHVDHHFIRMYFIFEILVLAAAKFLHKSLKDQKQIFIKSLISEDIFERFKNSFMTIHSVQSKNLS